MVLAVGQQVGRRIPTLDEVRERAADGRRSDRGRADRHEQVLTAYELLQRGEFSCRVIKVGKRWRVPKSALLELLGA